MKLLFGEEGSVMARGIQASTPKAAELSPDRMLEAIPRIQRRIEELQSFDPNTVTDRSDPRIGSLTNKLRGLLDQVFGTDTIERDRYAYHVTELDRAGFNMYGTPLGEVITGLQEGRASAIHHLQEIIAGFEEELEHSGGTPASRALRAYESLELHPEIARAATQLYKNGHYANAIEDSVKALNGLVRVRSGIDDKDGTALMENVFSPKNPVLKFNSRADESDINEQKGFMMMFSGAVAGLRNPRAHKIIKDDPEQALEFIAFVSLLAKLLDRAVK